MPIALATKQLDELQRVAEHYQNTFDAIENQGGRITAADYENLQNNVSQQIDVVTTLRDENAKRMNETIGTDDYDTYAAAYIQNESALA